MPILYSHYIGPTVVWKVCFISLHPFLALCVSYFVSHRVIVCVSLFFPHPSLFSFCPLSFARAPPLCLYVAEEQLSRAGHKVGQAVRLQAPQSSNTELIVSHTSSHTHSPVLLTHKPHAHIHLKVRQEGVGSWTHISWVSIEVHQRELWHLKLEKAESEECNMWNISSATSQKMPFTVCAGWSNTGMVWSKNHSDLFISSCKVCMWSFLWRCWTSV